MVKNGLYLSSAYHIKCTDWCEGSMHFREIIKAEKNVYDIL